VNELLVLKTLIFQIAIKTQTKQKVRLDLNSRSELLSGGAFTINSSTPTAMPNLKKTPIITSTVPYEYEHLIRINNSFAEKDLTLVLS
jgi:hypothetical protein